MDVTGMPCLTPMHGPVQGRRNLSAEAVESKASLRRAGSQWRCSSLRKGF